MPFQYPFESQLLLETGELVITKLPAVMDDQLTTNILEDRRITSSVRDRQVQRRGIAVR